MLYYVPRQAVAENDTELMLKLVAALRDNKLEVFTRATSAEFASSDIWTYMPEGIAYDQVIIPEERAAYDKLCTQWLATLKKCKCPGCKRAGLTVKNSRLLREDQCHLKPLAPRLHCLRFFVMPDVSGMAVERCYIDGGYKLRVYKFKLCDHDWVHTGTPANCLNTYKCAKCNDTKSIDSSD